MSERAYSALSESGWHDGASANFSIVQDSTAPRSPSGVGEARFPAGFASGNTPMMSYINISGQAPAIYTSFWLKLSPNFQVTENKILWFSIGDRIRATLGAVGSTNTGALRPMVELRSVIRSPAMLLAPNVNAAAEVKRGEWQRWELVIRSNSAANADGSVELWIDGMKATTYTGIQFVNATEGHTWQSIAWAPYWSGSGTVPVSQYMRMDHMYVGGGTPAAVAAVASVRVTAPSANLVAGDSAQLLASALDASGNVVAGSPMTWTSSDPSIVSVTSSGLATARQPGSASITAASGGQAGSVTLSVVAAPVPVPVPVASVSVTSPVQSLYPSQTAQLSAVVRDSTGNTLSGRAVSWSSSATGVANVSSTGLVTAVATGSVTITATSEGRSGSATLSVVQVPVAAVRVTPGTSGLSVGQGVQLVAVAVDSAGNTLSGRSISWSSSSAAIATVSSAGYVTAAGGGTATISATSGTISGQATITVTAPVASVAISAPATSIAVGSTVQLTATTRDANGTVLTGRAIAWSSSATAVATVNSTGLVTTNSAGTASITATSEGRSASITITATAPPPPPPAGSNEPSGLTAFSDRHFQALNEAGWTDYMAGNFSLVPDATAPQAQATVGQVLYPAGFAGGTEPVNLYVPLGNRNTVYLAFWFKMSPNFYGHPTSSVNKIFHIFIGGANRVYLAAMGSGNTATFQPQIRLQQVPATANYNLGPNLVPSASMVRDRWYKWEVVLHANTPGVADGTVEMWLDGVKIGSYTGVQFVAAGQGNTWESLNWAPTWGGAGGTVPADQWMRMSEVYLSGR